MWQHLSLHDHHLSFRTLPGVCLQPGPRLLLPQHAWHPAVSEVVAGATPVTRASRFYRVASTWRHYEELAAALPDGLLATADAVCSFNPIYVSVADSTAQHSTTLGLMPS